MFYKYPVAPVMDMYDNNTQKWNFYTLGVSDLMSSGPYIFQSLVVFDVVCIADF